MNRWITLLIVLVMAAILGGCALFDGFQKPEGGPIVTPQEHAQLPPDEQPVYVPITYRAIKPKVVQQVDAGLAGAQTLMREAKPLVPTSVWTVAALALGLATTTWQTIKKQRVSLGSRITAKNVDRTLKKGSAERNDFLNLQAVDSANTKAIMPDKV